MTTNQERAAMLTRALRSRFEHGSQVGDLFTDDVRVWTPALNTSSLAELLAEAKKQDDAFSDVQLEVNSIDAGGDYACAEWCVSMTHVGPLELARGTILEPTGVRITLYGVTVAEFRGPRICSLRQYWDELSALEQLGLFAEAG